MQKKMLIAEIVKYIDDVISKKTARATELWGELLAMHPADSAQLFTYLQDDQLRKLFLHLPTQNQLNIFRELPDTYKEKVLDFLNDSQKSYFFRNIPIDDLTDLFDDLSDEELKKSLDILHKKERQQVLSLLKFPTDSAGGIMTVDVVTFIQDVIVSQAISLLQRLKPNVDLHRQIYVTDNENKLVGYINLEDLVTQSPNRKLQDILRQVLYSANAQEDQEEIAKNMVHYHMMTVPVVDKFNNFLGVIPEDTLIDIIKEEATEDIQRMSGAPVTTTYFEMSFFKLLYHRCFILVFLLILESLTSVIVHRYESVLTPFLVMFFAMLVSTGGNTSSQAATVAIQGMYSGDINSSNLSRFIRREFLMGFLLAIILSIVAFIRVYFVHRYLIESLIVSISLGLIVLFSVLLGATFPIMLKKLGVDPAFSASPFLATMMDILGIFIYCYVAYLVLS